MLATPEQDELALEIALKALQEIVRLNHSESFKVARKALDDIDDIANGEEDDKDADFD